MTFKHIRIVHLEHKGSIIPTPIEGKDSYNYLRLVPCKSFSLYGIRLFVHKDHRYKESIHGDTPKESFGNGKWVVSEHKSGFFIAHGRTREQAIDNAKRRFDEYPLDGIQRQINEKVEQYGIANK